MTGRDYDDQIGTALFADGLGTTIAGFGGGSGTTTYGENIGVMAATKVYSTAAYWCAAAFALILSLCPKFGAVINTIPAGVLGGVTTLLYGMIGMIGIRIWWRTSQLRQAAEYHGGSHHHDHCHRPIRVHCLVAFPSTALPLARS